MIFHQIENFHEKFLLDAFSDAFKFLCVIFWWTRPEASKRVRTRSDARPGCKIYVFAKINVNASGRVRARPGTCKKYLWLLLN